MIVFFGISYNFFLSVINANFTEIDPYITYIVEATLIFLSFLNLHTHDLKIIKWILYSLLVVNGIEIIRIFFGITPDLKFFRDQLIEYAYLCLGLSYRKKMTDYLHFLIKISLFIAIISFIELKWTLIYEMFVDPRAYYIAAKKFNENSFWQVGSKLFLSASRPDQRFFFSYSNLIRSSSIFLEPVTMGNFIIFLSSVYLSFFTDLSKKQKIIFVFLIMFLIIAADSRLAFYTLIVLFISIPFSIIIKKDLSVYSALLIILAGSIIQTIWQNTPYQDNLLGRISYSYEVLYHLSLLSWLGLDQKMNDHYWDSGLSYMVVSQSIFFILWNLFMYQFVFKTNDLRIMIFKNTAIIAVVLSLIVSNSFFSIKTASLWWFSVGYFWYLSSDVDLIKNRKLKNNILIHMR